MRNVSVSSHVRVCKLFFVRFLLHQLLRVITITQLHRHHTVIHDDLGGANLLFSSHLSLGCVATLFIDQLLVLLDH